MNKERVKVDLLSVEKRIVGVCVLLLYGVWQNAHARSPETVHFTSDDGQTKLVAYVFQPATPGPHPAIVMLHGRSGLYSSAKQNLDADSLSSRNRMWGEFWAERGYVGVFVDTFGPRGYPRGFAAGTNRRGGRPPEVNEITVRPLDAYAGLKYLRSRPDVIKDRIFLQGWSNGGSATLASVAITAPGLSNPSQESGFRAAIALYPACTQVAKYFTKHYRTYTPTLLLIGTKDEEVQYANCEKLAALAKQNGSDVEFVLYRGATHSYDTPIAKRLAVPENAAATTDTMKRAEAFFKKFLP